MTSPDLWRAVAGGLLLLGLVWLAMLWDSVRLLALWHNKRWVTGTLHVAGAKSTQPALGVFELYQRPRKHGRMRLVHEEAAPNRSLFVVGAASWDLDIARAYLLLRFEHRWASDGLLHVRQLAMHGETVTLAVVDRGPTRVLQPSAVFAGDVSAARATLLKETFWLLLPLLIGLLTTICAGYVDLTLWAWMGSPPCP